MAPKMTSKFWLVLIIGIALRLILMPITFHPDLLGHVLTEYFFIYDHIFNIYDHLANLPVNHPLVQNFGVSDIFIYPPLTYLFIGSLWKGLSFAFNQQFLWQLMSGLSPYQPSLYWHLFFLKLPYLFIDLGLAFLLTHLFKDFKNKFLIFTLWMFNPATLYATFSMGVFDVLPAFLTVAAAVCLKSRKPVWAALLLGLGASFKSYPLFLLPIVVLGTPTNWLNRVKIAFFGLLPFILSIAPFLQSSAFKYMVFGPKSQKMLFMEFMVSGAEGIYPFVLGLTLICLLAWRRQNIFVYFWQYFLCFFLLLFSLTHFHPQWLMWLAPFLVIQLVANNFRNLLIHLGLLACFIFIILTFENSLSFGLFAPLNQNLNQINLVKFISAKTDLMVLKSFARSLIAALSIYLSYDCLFAKNDHK